MGQELHQLQHSWAKSFLRGILILWIQEFDAYIQDALVNPKYTCQKRRQLLVDWEQVRLHTLPQGWH